MITSSWFAEHQVQHGHTRCQSSTKDHHTWRSTDGVDTRGNPDGSQDWQTLRWCRFRSEKTYKNRLAKKRMVHRATYPKWHTGPWSRRSSTVNAHHIWKGSWSARAETAGRAREPDDTRSRTIGCLIRKQTYLRMIRYRTGQIRKGPIRNIDLPSTSDSERSPLRNVLGQDTYYEESLIRWYCAAGSLGNVAPTTERSRGDCGKGDG